MSNFPTFNTINPPGFIGPPSPIDMMEMGITHNMYVKLQKVAADNHCVIMIRKTNKGSVMPFANRTAVGKKLATKGKSSDAFFTKGNITFLAQMAKRLAPESWFKEQCELISLLGENSSAGKRSGAFIPKYKFIPKLLTIEMFNSLINSSKGLFEGYDFEKDAFIIKVPNDKIAGIKAETIYKLVKTTWGQVNGEFGNVLVPPIQNIQVNTPLYRVYVKTQQEAFPFLQPLSQEVRGSLSESALTQTGREQIQNALRNETPARPPSAGRIRSGQQAAIRQTEAAVNERQTTDGVVYDVLLPKILELRLWEQKTYTDDEQGQNAIMTAIGNNFEHCAPPLANDPNFREVRVLALRTRGTGLETRTDQAVAATQDVKKYYEVVADYDIFMVAPEISELVFEGNDVLINIGTQRLSVLPRLGSHRSIKPRPTGNTENAYGLLSPYDFHIRQEINRGLGIKVAQHGAEIANLFYTSDIRDPVIAIYPDGRVAEIATTAPAAAAAPQDSLPGIGTGRGGAVGHQAGTAAPPPAARPVEREVAPAFAGPDRTTEQSRNFVSGGFCFLMSLEMLFEMMNIRTNMEKSTRPLGYEEIAKTYGTPAGTGIEYTFHKNNFTAEYGIIMNLNWGTEAYYKFNIKSGYEYGAELTLKSDYEKLTDEVKTAVKKHHESFAIGIFNNYIDKTEGIPDFSRLNELFHGFVTEQQPFNFAISDLPISIRTFLFYLYRMHTRYNARLRWTRVQGARHVADITTPLLLQNHFIKTLSFFEKVYQSILDNGISVQKAGANPSEHYKYDALINIYERAIYAIGLVVNKVEEDARAQAARAQAARAKRHKRL